MYSVPAPAPRYDINSGDFVHPNYADQFNGFNTGSVEPPYSQYMPNGVFPPTFQDANSAFYHQAPGGGFPDPSFQPNGYTFDGGPTFQQMSPLSGNTPSSSSQLSFETTWTPPPGPSFGNIPQLYPEVLEDNAPPPSAAPRARHRRTRGPNRRPPGTGFSDLLVRFIAYLVSKTSPNLKRKNSRVRALQDELPNDVRAAVEAYNPACCGNKRPPEEGKGKEDSSRLKHIFSNRHCAGLPKYIQDEVLRSEERRVGKECLE